jgi:hypothetical protein
MLHKLAGPSVQSKHGTLEMDFRTGYSQQSPGHYRGQSDGPYLYKDTVVYSTMYVGRAGVIPGIWELSGQKSLGNSYVTRPPWRECTRPGFQGEGALSLETEYSCFQEQIVGQQSYSCKGLGVLLAVGLAIPTAWSLTGSREMISRRGQVLGGRNLFCALPSLFQHGTAVAIME